MIDKKQTNKQKQNRKHLKTFQASTDEMLPPGGESYSLKTHPSIQVFKFKFRLEFCVTEVCTIRWSIELV